MRELRGDLNGVINGGGTFPRRIRDHGQGGDFLNTASMAGLSPGAANELWVLTHPDLALWVAERGESILAGFKAPSASSVEPSRRSS